MQKNFKSKCSFYLSDQCSTWKWSNSLASAFLNSSENYLILSLRYSLCSSELELLKFIFNSLITMEKQ